VVADIAPSQRRPLIHRVISNSGEKR
jgi:hypothetical protein